MKVFAYQIEPKLLDLKGNLEQVLAKIHQGKEKGADLVVFPELALTGYFLGQRYHEVALRRETDPEPVTHHRHLSWFSGHLKPQGLSAVHVSPVKSPFGNMAQIREKETASSFFSHIGQGYRAPV